MLSFGKLISLLKTKTRKNYKQTKNLQVHEKVRVFAHYCFAFRLMYGFKGSLEAELQERTLNVRKPKHEQLGTEKPMLFLYIGQIQIVTCKKCDDTHSSLSLCTLSGMLIRVGEKL